jgi:GTPase
MLRSIRLLAKGDIQPNTFLSYLLTLLTLLIHSLFHSPFHSLPFTPLGPGTSSHNFLDRLTLTCTGGFGGRGSISFEHLPRSKRRPDGGNGGNGGSVLIRSSSKVQNLQKPPTLHLKAGDGGMGHGQKRHGKTGENLVYSVPNGIIVKQITYPNHVYDLETWLNEGNDSSSYDEKSIRTIADLNVDGSEILVSKGGVGGMGNSNYISLYGRDLAVQSKVSEAAVPSKDPESWRVVLELKSIADVGLLGMPNAGKSSLLSCLSKVSRLREREEEANGVPPHGNHC